MPLNKKFNLVCFKVDDDGPRIFIQLEGEFVLSAGIAPNVNRALVPHGEFDKLVEKDGIKTLGTVEFWFSDEPTRQVDPDDPDDEDPKPDHSIAGVRLVDVEPVKIGVPRGQTAPRIVQYRLILADMRERFVDWRGGMLNDGDINSATARDADLISNNELISRCLSAMGASFQIGIDVVADLLSGLPMRDLHWSASSAPEELHKLLEYCRATLIVTSEGKLEIVTMGSGEDPEIPEGREVPGLLKMPGKGRRGKTVILTSAPNPIIETLTLSGPDHATWEFVVRDAGDNKSRPWVAIDQCSLLGNKSAAEHMKDGFKDVAAAYREDMRAEAFHYIRLNKDAKDPKIQTMLRLCKEGIDDWREPVAAAKIATQHEEDGQWHNEGEAVQLHIAHLLHDPASGEPIIQCWQLLGKVSSDGVDSIEKNFVALTSGELEVRASYYAKDKNGKQEFFAIGFEKGPDGLSKIDEQQLAALIEKADKDVVFVPVKELQLHRLDGEDQNRSELEEKAAAMAELFLRGSENEYVQRMAAGFLSGELGGKITEIRWDQNECKTTFKVNAWAYPHYIAGVRERLKAGGGQLFPSQNQTAGSRLALGGVASVQPAVPIMPGPRPGGTATGGIDVWNCPNAKVVASARAERFAVGFSVSKITIEGADAAYVEHNFADSDEITIDQDPQGSLCPPIKWKQVPAGDSFDRVTNVFSTGDGIYKTTATRTQDFVKGGGADSDVQTSLVISIQDCPDAQAGSFAEAAAFGMSSNGFSGW
jgi:hypothetical protein